MPQVSKMKFNRNHNCRLWENVTFPDVDKFILYHFSCRYPLPPFPPLGCIKAGLFKVGCILQMPSKKHFWISRHCRHDHDHELEYNHATNLLSFLIADIPYLRSLHLDRNPLQKVEANAFEMIPQLVSLDLSHCNIKRVAARAFAQLTSLEKLFLQHNQISELRQKTVESITGEQKPFRQ